jgi:hypothetical protein
MQKLHLFGVLFALALTVLSLNAHADSFSCEGGIISTGDRNSDVMAKCGSPDFRDSHQEEVVQKLDADTKQKIYITVEEWTYNLGPNQFTRIVILKNGRVAEIKTGNYGYIKP